MWCIYTNQHTLCILSIHICEDNIGTHKYWLKVTQNRNHSMPSFLRDGTVQPKTCHHHHHKLCITTMHAFGICTCFHMFLNKGTVVNTSHTAQCDFNGREMMAGVGDSSVPAGPLTTFTTFANQHKSQDEISLFGFFVCFVVFCVLY